MIHYRGKSDTLTCCVRVQSMVIIRYRCYCTIDTVWHYWEYCVHNTADTVQLYWLVFKYSDFQDCWYWSTVSKYSLTVFMVRKHSILISQFFQELFSVENQYLQDSIFRFIDAKNTDMLESQILDTGNLYSVSTYWFPICCYWKFIRNTGKGR